MSSNSKFMLLHCAHPVNGQVSNRPDSSVKQHKTRASGDKRGADY